MYISQARNTPQPTSEDEHSVRYDSKTHFGGYCVNTKQYLELIKCRVDESIYKARSSYVYRANVYNSAIITTHVTDIYESIAINCYFHCVDCVVFTKIKDSYIKYLFVDDTNAASMEDSISSKGPEYDILKHNRVKYLVVEKHYYDNPTTDFYEDYYVKGFKGKVLTYGDYQTRLYV